MSRKVNVEEIDADVLQETNAQLLEDIDCDVSMLSASVGLLRGEVEELRKHLDLLEQIVGWIVKDADKLKDDQA